MSGLLGVALGTPLPMSEVQIPDHWMPPEPEHIARLLPQYRIEHLIGRGGMGAVYKGTQIKLNRSVAIKVLPAELARSTEFIGRFQREAQLLASLNHQGIVAIFDFGQTDEGHLYFVMEYVDGTDLHRLIHRSETKLTPAQALSLTTQICEALQFAHDQGVVHRDIKPANVLVTKDFRAKLADFGLAMKPSDGSDQPAPHVPMPQGFSPLSPADPALAGLRFTRTGNVMGTPPYAAPEVYYGQADERSDIFALGIMFYEMLTGQVPEERYILPSQKVGVDQRLDEVVMKALDAEPKARFQQASEMKLAVEAASQPLPAKAPAPPKAAAAPVTQPFRPPARPASSPPAAPRRKASIWFYLLTSLMVVGGLGWWAWDALKMMGDLRITTPVATTVAEPQTTAPIPSPPPSASPVSISSPIIGRWWWPGNSIVTFRTDGTFETSYGIRSTWTREPSGTFVLNWRNITSDRLHLKARNQVLEGLSPRAWSSSFAYRMPGLQGPPSSTAPSTAEAGFIPLFDSGHTSGWKHVGAGNFTTENGVLTTSTPADTSEPWGLLWYPGRTFKNFILRVEFAVDSMETNSGIFIRTPLLPDRKPDLFMEGAYEVEIKGTDTGRITLVPLPGDTNFPLPIRTWNDLEITAIGQQYTVTLNGQTTARFTGNRNQSGYIALQNLGNTGSAYFRRVRIKDLGENAESSLSTTQPPRPSKTIDLAQLRRDSLSWLAEARTEAATVTNAAQKAQLLKQIARTFATAGTLDEALKTARSIQDDTVRDSTFATIAERQAGRGEFTEAFDTAVKLTKTEQARDSGLIHLATALIEQDLLSQAERVGRELKSADGRSRYLSSLALYALRKGDKASYRKHIDEAKNLVTTAAKDSQPAFNAVTSALVKGGDLASAKSMIPIFRGHRFATPWGHIIRTQAEMGDFTAAHASLGEARLSAYPQAVALARVSEAEAAAGKFNQARSTANGIPYGDHKNLAFCHIEVKAGNIAEARKRADGIFTTTEMTMDSLQTGIHSRAMFAVAALIIEKEGSQKAYAWAKQLSKVPSRIAALTGLAEAQILALPRDGYRIFTDNKGAKLEAELIAIGPKEITLRAKRDQKLYPLPQERLSASDLQDVERLRARFAVSP